MDLKKKLLINNNIKKDPPTQKHLFTIYTHIPLSIPFNFSPQTRSQTPPDYDTVKHWVSLLEASLQEEDQRQLVCGTKQRHNYPPDSHYCLHAEVGLCKTVVFLLSQPPPEISFPPTNPHFNEGRLSGSALGRTTGAWWSEIKKEDGELQHGLFIITHWSYTTFDEKHEHDIFGNW